ncbi:hypothetical protein OH76DRAFT_213490 [Lentinus brumalis]|uniref:Uncharacterized protein n=1 Tax=Lentinus brumalis TaxID=2498619 RepID=A0A371CMM0_9APHY|nr:hypothetical protein OH76DRAFT_213490 [Polyporus brumalis]
MRALGRAGRTVRGRRDSGLGTRDHGRGHDRVAQQQPNSGTLPGRATRIRAGSSSGSSLREAKSSVFRPLQGVSCPHRPKPRGSNSMNQTCADCGAALRRRESLRADSLVFSRHSIASSGDALLRGGHFTCPDLTWQARISGLKLRAIAHDFLPLSGCLVLG